MEEQLKVVISADTNGFDTDINKTKKNVKKFGDESEKTAAAFDDAMNEAKAACKAAMTAIAGAIAGAITAMVALAESTRELRTNQAKLTTAFENAGASAEVATKVYDDLFRVLGDDGQTTEAANHLAKLTTNEQELAQWTEICKGVYAQFGDSLPIEGLTEAANETAKVGAVTGSLADALNWAGESEDAFNEKLEKCNSEAEREELIRSTLNKLYQNSAKNYEKNNKSVLKANDAQNKLNKVLAETGEYVEPINAEIKELGATLLKDAQKPMKEIARYLTGTLFPAIKSTYNWLKSNLPTVSALVVGMTTAYVGYKAAVISAKLAEDGLTAAVILRTAAQKALNLVMNANPYVLLVTAIVALTGAMLAYGIAAEESRKVTFELSAEEQALRDNVNATADALAAASEQRKENAAQIQGEAEYTKRLADELFSLADASGKVKAEDEVRAQFILNELNSALGTEISMIDGVIQNYEELKGSINEVIQAKTAEALLADANAAFIEAKKNENQQLAQTAQLWEAYQNQLTESQPEIDRILNELIDLEEQQTLAAETGNEALARITAEQIARLEEELKAHEDAVKGKKDAFDESAAQYQQYSNDIIKYENAQQAVLEGNYQKAIDILTKETGAYGEYADNIDAETAKVLDALFKKAVDTGKAAEETKTNWENGVEGYTEEMVKETAEAHEAALEEWANAYAEANTIGGDLGDGLNDGMESKRGSLASKARSLVQGILAAMKSEADSHSPSKKTMAFGEDLGAGAEIGIDDSTGDVVKASKNMVSESLKAIQGISARNFSGLVSGSVLSARSAQVSGKTIAAPEASALLSALGEKLGGNTPIILEVDGKVFAQTAINTINKQTRQTGKLALALV